MRFASVCSGIESATVAWLPLGWWPAFYAEIEAFPSAVLAHHYPETPNLGDITQFVRWNDAAIDVLVGGTPCQDFSIAGRRAGLAGARGNLTLTYLEIAERYRPDWLVFENVPGILSIDNGRALGFFLGRLGQLGYGWAYRVLDAQYFRLAQRRKRVFVVGSLRGWPSAAAVLFERASLRRDPPPSREAGQKVAGTIRAGSGGGCGPGPDEAKQGLLIETSSSFAFKASHYTRGKDGGPSAIAPALSADADKGDQDLLVFASAMAGSLDARSGDGFNGQDAYNGGNNTRGPIQVATAVRAKGGSGHGDFDSETFICFDEAQITHPENRSNPRPGNPSPALSAHARPPTVAFNIYPASGQDADLKATETDIAAACTTVDAKEHERGTRIIAPQGGGTSLHASRVRAAAGICRRLHADPLPGKAGQGRTSIQSAWQQQSRSGSAMDRRTHSTRRIDPAGARGMSYSTRHPAAFINALAEGPKVEALTWLQRTWDDLVDAKDVVRQAIAIVENERECIHTSYKEPDGVVHDPGAHAELRNFYQWLQKARAAVA